jgi:hypothetical protein
MPQYSIFGTGHMNGKNIMQQTSADESYKWILPVLNNLYDISRKVGLHGDPGNIRRNVDRIVNTIKERGVFYDDPMGQSCDETRTDLEVDISSTGAEDLFVVDVIKPIIRIVVGNGDKIRSRVVQKGIVVVRSKLTGAH